MNSQLPALVASAKGAPNPQPPRCSYCCHAQAEPSSSQQAAGAGEGQQEGPSSPVVPVPEDLLPFGDVGNPVMAQVSASAFLMLLKVLEHSQLTSCEAQPVQ